MYSAIRVLDATDSPATTTLQLQSLLTLLASSSIETVAWFAGPLSPERPSLVLLASGRFPGIGPAEAIYDGLTLSIDTPAHYAEVRELLDLAVASRKCAFSATLAPPTAHLPPREAIAALRALDTLQPLTHQSRPVLFSLLSTVGEAEISDILRVRTPSAT